MKIEKLTENKIRVVVDENDLHIKSLDIKSLSKALEKQEFFADVLEKAKTELGFNADGHKLLIETFSLNNDFVIFTITKYSFYKKNKPITKKKTKNEYYNCSIYKFESFEEFCAFCNCINNINNFNYKSFSKDFSLYLYKNTYYLLIKNINHSMENKEVFYSLISEFARNLSFSKTLENKLIEYGKIIIGKNAIEKTIKYFS